MAKNTKNQFSESDLRQLLGAIDQESAIPASPLSDKDMAEIENELVYETISPERDERLRRNLEEMRSEWFSDQDMPDSLFNQATKVGVTRQAITKQMRIDLSILLKLERRIITDVPHRAIKQLAENLEIPYRSVYLYLTQPPKGLQQMAASSKGQPEESQPESWVDAISNSKMAEEDKAYWLDV